MKLTKSVLVGIGCSLLLFLGVCPNARATDPVFDLTTFCCPCLPDDHFCQPQFDALNWAANATKPNGHYCFFSTDAHRLECLANGNDIAQYYNALNTNWTTTTAVARAQQINDAAVANMTTNGPKPVWVALNEISAGTWPTNATYRQWVIDVCHWLRVNHGRNVVIYSPWANPAANDASWQTLAAEAYICPEIYLSGKDIKANGFSQTWCQSKYQTSKNTYITRGVPVGRIMMVEHYGNTIDGSLDDGTPITWGRTGVTASEWSLAIQVRTRAYLAVGFAGYHSYAWGKNAMLASDTELIGFENTYAAEMGGGATPPPPPAAPTGLNATAGNAQVALAWTASSGATSYNVKRATTTGGPYSTVATGVTSTSYTDTGVVNGTTYYYVVSALNSGGESANATQVSATPSAPTVPAVPTGLTAVAQKSPGKIKLTWNAASGATSYNAKRATVSGGPYTTIATGISTPTYTDSGLTSGTTYYYVVSAVNAAGESANSAQASATSK